MDHFINDPPAPFVDDFRPVFLDFGWVMKRGQWEPPPTISGKFIGGRVGHQWYIFHEEWNGRIAAQGQSPAKLAMILRDMETEEQ